MNVFICWSGAESQAVAEALRDWLPRVIQSAKPWMSGADVESGARWNHEIQRKLEETRFGVVCLTRGNVKAQWIHFESGALAKTIEDTYVCPYLRGISPSDIPQGPLNQFQARRANEEDTKKLVQTINRACGDLALTESILEDAFESMWPRLQKTLREIPADETVTQERRDSSDILEEVLDVVRGIARSAAREFPSQPPTGLAAILGGQPLGRPLPSLPGIRAETRYPYVGLVARIVGAADGEWIPGDEVLREARRVAFPGVPGNIIADALTEAEFQELIESRPDDEGKKEYRWSGGFRNPE